MNDKKYILRYFREGENKKIITTIKKKIYFSENQNLAPGYYIGEIVADKQNFGIINAKPINEIPAIELINNNVKYAFIKADKAAKKLSIYLARPPKIGEPEVPVRVLELSEEQAKSFWGENYRENILKKHDGIKEVTPDGYSSVDYAE